jgi:predicted GNAT superfamily acetyltransferase
VGAARVSDKVEGFRFRRLEKPEEFRQVQEIERAIWGDAATPLSVPLLRSVQDNGGLVVGAFADIYLAGCAASHIGWDGTTLYHFAQLLAVRPEYQNHHLGFQLKALQREEVLRLGLKEVRWTFDPLQSRIAWLAVHRLGALPDQYFPHYFGQLADTVNRGSETDRVRAVWSLESPNVVARMDGQVPGPDEMQRRWAGSSAILETEPGESGIRVPTAVGEPQGESAHLEVPFDLDLVRQHEPKSVWKWRHASRDAFRAASDVGYVVDDFAVVSADHERRSFYFFRKAPTTGKPSP